LSVLKCQQNREDEEENGYEDNAYDEVDS